MADRKNQEVVVGHKALAAAGLDCLSEEEILAEQ